MGEFPPVQEFRKVSLARSFALSPVASAIASTPVTSNPCGKTCCNLEVDDLIEAVRRNVAQKKQVQSEVLQQKLSNANDKGHEWFDHFEFDKSGKLSQEALKSALSQTLVASQSITRGNSHLSSIASGMRWTLTAEGPSTLTSSSASEKLWWHSCTVKE